MREEVLASVLANPGVEPTLAIWGWQIATYLFLGGLAAGLMVFSGWVVLSGRTARTPFAANRAPLVGLVLLGIGMGTLFLDLERKINVWRFYAFLHDTSPMSWGAWILLLVFPVLALLALAGMPEGFPGLAAYICRLPVVGRRVLLPVIGLCGVIRRPLALLGVVLGIGLGIYTGVLLSSFNARPFWHSALLGPLFLVSGLSTGAALMILGAGTKEERHLFGRIDLGLIVAELALIFLFVIDMLNGDALQRAAVAHVLGGSETHLFWIGFIGLGLAIPLVLEAAMWWRSITLIAGAASVLVLLGGFLLRDVMITTGQQTTWTSFNNQFNPGLLAKLRTDGENPNGRF
ncbi:NrfD/PsrC family molybdoenzyme membrane anchor subunit [Acidiphilium sp.]|uniref:NrfD/PsrC family molybdoenzyme membrane anchor subunit n=1 Tax=Acidiphilium sp. TaxID=527 RepID=UPI003CFF7D47